MIVVEKSCVDAPIITNSLKQESRVYWLPKQVVYYQCQGEWTFKYPGSTSVTCQLTEDETSAEWSDHENIQCIPGKHRSCIVIVLVTLPPINQIPLTIFIYFILKQKPSATQILKLKSMLTIQYLKMV